MSAIVYTYKILQNHTHSHTVIPRQQTVVSACQGAEQHSIFLPHDPDVPGNYRPVSSLQGGQKPDFFGSL